jgi:type IV protein arginine methyltransferase
VGNVQLVLHLLQAGAPWNAVDRNGNCAGNFATRHEHWSVVNVLVDWAVQAELLLGRVQYNQRRARLQQQIQKSDQQDLQPDRQRQQQDTISSGTASKIRVANATAAKGIINIPVQHEPCSKPDYLSQPLSYTADGRALLDRDHDAVMMEWERPIMRAHAQILMEEEHSQQQQVAAATETAVSEFSINDQEPNSEISRGKTVLNVGFGMGIIDTILQQGYNPQRHYIVEAHPDVYRHMLEQGWDQKPNVVLLFGKWQDVIPQLVAALQQQGDGNDEKIGCHFL